MDTKQANKKYHDLMAEADAKVEERRREQQRLAFKKQVRDILNELIIEAEQEVMREEQI